MNVSGEDPTAFLSADSADQAAPVLAGEAMGGSQPPHGVGENLPSDLRHRLHQLFLTASGQLGTAYAARVANPAEGPTALLSLSPDIAANVGALSSRLAVIAAVFDEKMPGGPSSATKAASSVRSLLRNSTQQDVQAHLTRVLTRLEELAEDPAAVQAEASDLKFKSAQLDEDAEKKLHNASGVYVFTYPHYLLHPYVAGSERRLLKVGRTNHGAGKRILSQVRSTSAPEDPLLLRVYVTPDSVATEKTFHQLLKAAEHLGSGGVVAGKEWFSTTLDFCDEIAKALSLEILSRGVED